MSTFTNGYRNTIKIEMNRSDKNRFKHFNFLIKFDLFFRVDFQNLMSNLTSSFLNLALVNLGKFTSRAKFGKLFKFKLPFLNFINLTAKVVREFYKIRKPTKSNFISKMRKRYPRYKSSKSIASNFILTMSN